MLFGLVIGTSFGKICDVQALKGAQFVSNDIFINLRATPNGKILRNLSRDDFFVGVYIYGMNDENTQWYEVCTFDEELYPNVAGFIHHSQIIPLEKLRYEQYILDSAKQTFATLDTALQNALLKDIPALFDIEVDVDSASNNNATLVFMHPRVRALLSALGRKDYESALFWSGFHKDSQTKPSYAYLNTAHILLTHHIRNIKDDKRLWFNIFRFRDSKKDEQTQMVQYLLEFGLNTNTFLGKYPYSDGNFLCIRTASSNGR